MMAVSKEVAKMMQDRVNAKSGKPVDAPKLSENEQYVAALNNPKKVLVDGQIKDKRLQERRGRSVVNPNNPKINTPVAKKAKYGNKKYVVGEIAYDSKKEARICEGLKLREKSGQISDLKFQVHFPLKCNRVEINGELYQLGWMIFREYIADAVYMENGKQIVLDAKGFRTSAYKRQRRLMKLVYNITITEI